MFKVDYMTQNLSGNNKIDVSDIVNRKTALEILNITPATLSVYISKGKIRVVSRNAVGQPFFSRKELLGIQ